NALAIVAHPHQAHAAFLEVDVDPARAGIEGVLDQLLDHRRRAFDDFAGGDLVDEGVGKLADAQGTALARRIAPDRFGPAPMISELRPIQRLPPLTAADEAPPDAAACCANSVPGGGWLVK